jgi:hypothetical protein
VGKNNANVVHLIRIVDKFQLKNQSEIKIYFTLQAIRFNLIYILLCASVAACVCFKELLRALKSPHQEIASP